MENALGMFVVADSGKCSGCKACEIACFVSHNKNNGVCRTVGSVTTPVIPRLYLTKLEGTCMPIQCKQCEDAPCLNSCSANAITKVDGTMVVNEKLCIGCKNCMMACPFGAIELLPLYDEGKAVPQMCTSDTKVIAYKCDRCIETGEPACVKVCPHEALRLVKPNEDLKAKKLKAAMALAITNV